MMNRRAVMHDWFSVLDTVNQNMLQLIAIVRKNSQHGFARADDASGCRTKPAEKLFGIALRAQFHSQLDQRRKCQPSRLQCLLEGFPSLVRVLELEVFFLQFLFEALALSHIARGSENSLKLARLIVEGSRVIADDGFVAVLRTHDQFVVG